MTQQQRQIREDLYIEYQTAAEEYRQRLEDQGRTCNRELWSEAVARTAKGRL